MSTKTKNILYIPAWYPSEKDALAGNFIYDLAHDVADRDHQIDVWYPCLSYKYVGKGKVTHKSHKYISEYIYYGWSLPKINAWAIRRWIKNNSAEAKKHLQSQYDIIHTHGYVAAYLGQSFKETYKSKWCHTFHQHAVLTDQISQKKTTVLNSVFDKCDVFISPSSAVVSKTKNYFNINPRYSETIPNYVDFERVKLKESSSLANEVKCLSVGSLIDVKNYSTLIEIWKDLPSNFTLDIYGEGPLNSQLSDKIKSQHLQNQISIHPRVTKEDLLQLYHYYHIYVSTSKVETFGMAMLEAIAAGVPVVTTCNSGPADFINGANGYIINEEIFASTLVDISNNIDSYPPSSLRASVTSFEKSYVIEKYKEMYDRL